MIWRDSTSYRDQFVVVCLQAFICVKWVLECLGLRRGSGSCACWDNVSIESCSDA